jgi:uncharacterized membrane protein YsdA (DUF1294 family)/cold shock CspA family protein
MNPLTSESFSKNQHGFQASASLEGLIVEWVDRKGYGWIQSGERRVFVHIKDFDRGMRRPQEGEAVRFIEGIDAKGRMCARSVTFDKTGGRVGFGIWLLLALLLVLPLLALLWLPISWWQGAGAMLVVSAITYGMYAHDKTRAVFSGWRVQESTLHLAELLGGWPGALLAQRRLRHKCSKASYQFVFWSIVILFQIASADLILGHRLSRTLLEFVTKCSGPDTP